MDMAATCRDVLVVEGMFCASCAASVEAVLVCSPGVTGATVNFTADAAVVEWRPADTSMETLLTAVRKLGYRARAVGEDGDASDDTRRIARDLGLRLAFAVFFGMWTMFPAFGHYLRVSSDLEVMRGLAWAAGVFSLPVLVYSGLPFYRMGLSTLRAGVPGMDALISCGVVGSVGLSLFSLARGGTAVYFEVGVTLITLQLVARLLDLRVRRRAQDAVRSLLSLAPSEVSLLDADGRETRVPLKGLSPGVRLRVHPGERLAVDGVVLEGSAALDRSLLSGESAATPVRAGDAVHAGEQVLDGALVIELTSGAGKRRVDVLANQVRQLLAAKPAWQRAVDTVAQKFLWIAAAGAILGAAIALATGAGALAAATRALAVFVIACPCALSLAAPLAALFASSAAARQGILLRDLNAVTSAAVPTRLFLDKTGTLTQGRPYVVGVYPQPGETAQSVLAAAAQAESGSEHPLGRAIATAAPPMRAGGFLRALPGLGVEWADSVTRIQVGSADWMAHLGMTIAPSSPSAATRVHVAKDGRYLGAIDLEDTLRPGIADAITELRRRGVTPVILSGDAEAPVRRIAQVLDIEAHARLTPEEKLRYIQSSREQGLVTAFVGDGLNDGPALAAANLGIAVSEATDTAKAAAAVILLRAGVEVLPALFDLTARARRVIRQNFVWAMGYNLLAVPAALTGFVHPALAAAAMALSSITVLLNSARLLNTRAQVQLKRLQNA